MKLSISTLLTLTMLLTAVIAPLPTCAQTNETAELYRPMIQQGVAYLKKAQLPDGSFHRQADPGVTALVTTGLLRSGVSPDDAAVAKALGYLKSYVRDDGGIYREGSFYRNYETCLAIMCFVEANDDGRYDPLLAAAKAFVKQLQWDEGEGIATGDVEYGGAGYGRHKRPDLSNTQFMIDALLAAGEESNSEAIQRAIVFVSRCQNLPSSHNQTEFPAKNPDGGFYYTPASGGVSQAGEHVSEDGVTGGLRSYGSMTYAGLKSMIFAGLDATDPRVQAAVEWIEQNYDLTENPGMGDSGLYYYLHTFAKSLAALKQPTLITADGVGHNWRNDLIRQLASTQQEDGSWVNANERWLEGDKNLVTGYVLLALSYAEPQE